MDDAANNDATELSQQLVTAGHSAFDAGNYTRALENYHSATLIEARDPALWTALGLTFSNLDFPREAWRSYMLALSLDPADLNALWAAAEFLAEAGDMDLAGQLLGSYLQLETDPARLKEAQALQQQLHSEDAVPGRLRETTQQVDAGGPPAGNPSGPPLGAEAAQEVAEPGDFELSEEELTELALGEQRFLAPLALRLSGADGSCKNCGLNIPADAPYCWSCKMIHFYD